MRWEPIEFVLKGIYLGLLVVIALENPGWQQVGLIAAITLGMLAACLAISALQKLREGYRIRGRVPGFLLFLILENPLLVYSGVIVGLAFGAYKVLFEDIDEPWESMIPVAGGAILGYVFWNVRQWDDRRWRFWGSLTVAALLVLGFSSMSQRNENVPQDMIAYLLLLGIPGFYLLTLAGVVEESEIEIGAICAALGVSIYILATKYRNTLGEMGSHNPQIVLQVIPIALYFIYTRRVLPGLRVFKHVLRGISYAKVGRHRLALLSLGRALELEPGNRLARETLWNVYEDMDFEQVINDPETLAVINYDLCLERVAWLLLQEKPTPDQVAEALRLVDLIGGQRPDLIPPSQYWRAVALLHQRKYEEAAAALTSVLDAPAKDSAQRRSVLVQAWQLALFLHPEMIQRVGSVILTRPGRRMEAIAAVERHLAQKPDDKAVFDLKRFLYNDLTEAEYHASVPENKLCAEPFDHNYAAQLGMALLEDKERWLRGAEFLRIAACGMPLQAPAALLLIGKAYERARDTENQRAYYHRAKQVARAVGHANLSASDQESVFAATKWLADTATAQGNIDEAIDCYQFHALYDKAGPETYRRLADLYERRAKAYPDEEAAKKENDLWIALHCTEHALSYNAKDKDLLERKDRYYYSVTPEGLKNRLENVYKWFDTDYCKQRVRSVLEQKNGDLDLLDWAQHLADLAQTAQPDNLTARLLRARIKRQRGEVEDARQLMEEVRLKKPEKFPNSEEEESWYLANRYLGEMYVDDKPDQAVLCLLEYKNYPKSGASTIYNLGRAYENLGDHNRAIRCFEQVTAYEGNPLVWEAEEALRRLRGGGVAT
jgi:hypothetical protein